MIDVNKSSVYSATLLFFNSSFTADSKSSLAIFKSFNPDNPFVMDIYFYLTRLFDMGKRLFCWSLAHIGIEGNEEANEAAKRATTRTIATFKPMVYKDLKHNIKQFINIKFNGTIIIYVVLYFS